MQEKTLEAEKCASRKDRAGAIWRKRLIFCSISLISALCIVFFIVTDSHPMVDARPAPTPEQAAAAHDAVLLIRDSARAANGQAAVRLNSSHLDGISALATHGFRPDRLDVFVFDSALHVNASHELPMGRWLNVTGDLYGQDGGFPIVKLKIGALSLSPYLSRVTLEIARGGARVLGIDLPPLNDMIRSFKVHRDGVAVAISLPKNAGIVSRLMGMNRGLEASLVSEIYCRLAGAQAVEPNKDFAVQVRRAFGPQSSLSATPQSNDAAFIALAMAVVGKKAGSLAGADLSLVENCHMPPGPILLHGRSDLPMHWALSAALAVGPGAQFAEAMGEWKELADSLPKTSEFQRGNSSGFSFVDIAADRSGFRTSMAAGTGNGAALISARLARAAPNDILPTTLLSMKEGPSVDFAGKYGDLNDPRFVEIIKTIDAVLDREGLVRPEI